MAKLRYISLFSGIEAWSCAVAGIPEYEAVAFCEIDPFASAVLKHHYPDVPNLGDITKVDWSKYNGLVDLVVGGSPCQGFSVAGLRKGLKDDRSCLALAYIECIKQVQPKWILWENVPGVLYCNNGQDLRAFLAKLDELGYSLSWTILDSQWFSVPQRRRRVFLVGHSGGWEYPAKVLFKPESLRRHPPARKSKRQKDTAGTGAGTGNGGVAGTLCASGAGLDRPSASGNQLDYCVVDEPPAYAVRTAQTGANGIGIAEDSAHTLDGAGVQAVAVERERESNSLRNGGSPAVKGRQGDQLDHRRETYRGTASGKDVFPTICANCGDKQWLGNQEAFSGDYFIKEPR